MALRRANLDPEKFAKIKMNGGKGSKLEIGSTTCFGSMVWCCKFNKPCYLRDGSMEENKLDYKEYTALKKKLSEASVSRIHIERAARKANITIHTARPGVVIGKKGADIEKLRGDLANKLSRGLNTPTGYVLPLAWRTHEQRWHSAPWVFRRDRLYLTPGDSPMGSAKILPGCGSVWKKPASSACTVANG